MTVSDIMTKDVISVHPGDTLASAAKVIMEHDLDGVPVVDNEGILKGILTQYDLISKASALHLPTMQFLLQNMTVYKKDKKDFQHEVGEIMSLKVEDLMTADPLVFEEHTSYEDAVLVFKNHHRVNPVPVVDKEKHVVGVVSRFDILRPFQGL